MRTKPLRCHLSGEYFSPYPTFAGLIRRILYCGFALHQVDKDKPSLENGGPLPPHHHLCRFGVIVSLFVVSLTVLQAAFCAGVRNAIRRFAMSEYSSPQPCFDHYKPTLYFSQEFI